MSLLYDTNILIKIVRDKSKNENVRKNVNPTGLVEITSLVNKAEILSIALQNKWGNSKRTRLRELLEEIAVIDITDEQILDFYVNIDTFSQGKHPDLELKSSAKNMGKNDIWIAATVATLKCTLVTTDKDFDHLDGILINRILFDPDSL
jgi:tRNA(fMet)-specific endonuclease VapC